MEMVSRKRIILLTMAVFAMAAILIGCANKPENSDAGASVAQTAATSKVPANAPPQAAQSIQGSQAMGQAMQQRANANGAAMAKATRPQ